MQLLFATNNAHKAAEVQHNLPPDFRILSLKEAGVNIEIPEPFDTLEANADEKSGVVLALTGKDCFSEDTGLEVEALNGAPGVKSARFAGDDATDEENISKLLHLLEPHTLRKARFRTVISLRLNGKRYLFEGICKGYILKERRGTGGFGYDPVFVPDGDNRSFGEMSLAEKKQYSHRAKAMEQLIRFLTSYQP